MFRFVPNTSARHMFDSSWSRWNTEQHRNSFAFHVNSYCCRFNYQNRYSLGKRLGIFTAWGVCALHFVWWIYVWDFLNIRLVDSCIRNWIALLHCDYKCENDIEKNFRKYLSVDKWRFKFERFRDFLKYLLVTNIIFNKRLNVIVEWKFFTFHEVIETSRNIYSGQT